MKIKTGIGANSMKMANILIKGDGDERSNLGGGGGGTMIAGSKTGEIQDSKETLKEAESVESKSAVGVKRSNAKGVSETSSSFDEPEMLGLGNCAADLRHYTLK